MAVSTMNIHLLPLQEEMIESCASILIQLSKKLHLHYILPNIHSYMDSLTHQRNRDRDGEKSWEENLWEKLRRVGKRGRGGHSTPAASFWRTNELMHDHSRNANFGFISSRKLAAALWDLHHYTLPLHNMRRRLTTVPPPRRRPYEDIAAAVKEPLHPPSRPTPSHLPENSCNSRRIAAESLMQHHRSIEKSSRATPTVSPSSCGSSTEIAPCNPATSSSSIESKGRNVEPTYRLRTSTELLKVLNRIWSLEEQHVFNISLIKELKKELDRARFHAKELAREQQGSQHEIHGLMKHITGDNLLRKNKEQERISAAVQSVREELDNERNLRNRSESLQRNLAQELYDVKTSLASISKELEKERMSRGLLEDLCDELAWGLIDCEKEKHGQRQKSGEDLSERGDHDQLILRISQAWLHERMQVKQEHWHDVAEKNRTIDKLSSEIETFLQIERNSKTKIHGTVESIPLNVGASAPRDNDEDEDEDGSSSSESGLKQQEQKFQENHGEEMQKQKELMEKLKSSYNTRALSPLRLQAKFEEHLALAMPYGGSRNQVEDVEQITVEAEKDDISEHKHESEGISKLDSNYETDNLIRNYYSFLESGMQSNEDHGVASSFWRSFQSPVHEWTEKLPSQDLDISETPLKFLPEMKESTLREKAVEARTGGQKSRSRQTASIYPSRDE